ncbi:MAG: ROK family protein [Silvibacterium sp.]
MMQQSYPGAVAQVPLLNPSASHVIGIDIGGTSLRLALANSSGSVIAKWTASTSGMRDAQPVVDLILQGVDHLLRQSSLPRSALHAVAAGAPGITDVDSGIVIATSYLMGWRDVPLRALLESALGVPAAIDNDVNLAALGESWTGVANGVRDFVFLAVGTGIGAGIVLNGSLFHGMRWTAGEIGYMLVPGASEEPAERDEPGALESLAGGQGIRNQWQKVWSSDKTALPKDLTATQIFDYAVNDGDTLANIILHQSARMLAYAIYNMSLILSCPLFVLGGSVGLHPALCEATQTILQQRSERALPQVKQSALGADAQLTGAIRLALDVAMARSERSIAE